MKQYLSITFYILLFTLLTACGSTPNTSQDAGALTFNIKLSRPATAYQTAYLTGNDICIDYGVATVTAIVKDSSGKTITSGSWSCSAHQGSITGIPSGNNYTVTLEGKDSDNTVTWSGEKTGISISKGETTAAGTIAMTYVGSDTTAPTVTSTSPADSAPTVPVTSLLTATFSEKIAISSVNSITFTLTNNTTPVSGSVTYDSNTKKAIFIPATNLSYSSTYTATITTGVEDMAGNNIQADKTWSFTTEAPPTSAPSAPTGVSATAGNGQLTLTWEAKAGATSYNIYWSTTAGVTKTTGTIIAGVAIPYTHNGRNNGTTYYYVVTAVNGYGESAESNEVSATPVTAVTPDTTAPSNTIGANFINSGATAANSISVTLSISAADGVGVTGYFASENSATPIPSDAGWTSITSTTSYSADVTFTLSSGDGAKRVYVWFKDAAGNVSVSSSDIITLDTIPPDTTITSQPPNPTNSTSASFSFTSSETGSTFQCQLDNGGFSACTSPKSFTGLLDVNHTFEAKATDSAGNGNTDATPASYTWRIDVTAPTNTTITEFINSGAISTNSANVTLTLSATDNTGVTGYCAKESSATPSINDTCWASITSTISYSAGVSFSMSSGNAVKTVYIWFKDEVGNVSSPASDNITLAAAPSGPSNVVPAASDAQATVRWDSVSDTTSYNIYWSTSSGVTKSSGTKIAGVTSPYIHTGRTNGTAYYYVVTAVNDNGESEESYQVMVVPPQIPIRLPKTGQTTCYDSSAPSNVIACIGTGQDGELQRGVAWPNPRFTDNGGGTMTDNLTGLVWTKDANAPGPVACFPGNTKTWQGALDYVTCLNANNYLGYTDWRLPNINEIRSMIHNGQSNTATWLNTQGFNNVVQSNYDASSSYWTSTSLAYYPSRAWIVGMWHGGVDDGGKSSVYYVWPVRSGQSWLLGTSTISIPGTGQTTCYNSSGSLIACAGTGHDGNLQKGVAWPNPRYTDNGNGTVTDNLTGLVWTKDGNTPGPVTCSPSTTKTWQAALDYVACLNANSYLGYTDWRLPNVNELKSFVHYGQPDTATWLKTQGFNNVQSYYYWSSTSVASYLDGAWIVSMWDGSLDGSTKSLSYVSYVWPVRSGQ